MYDSIEELEDEYGYKNTIKALAISLNAITSKRLEKTIDVLIRYAKGVIKGADLDEDR
ncbi:hypothetical protein CBE01nite_46910 [Clostridium beijerinckii]|uniref:Uncharacterized protein n=1 Tax=Clostridium beijerinckii TaxID=1520 RepID=A0AAE5H5G3_CLOBE|nr:hypothetical protein [Clostridium beijerinckii]NSB15415.1 hypothetical protein [Clostridium beijerinckii]NYB97686.1 hypothetical protein [Clostridium beijerinckii]GEP66923.1 hypothetical protein CBE01nite_46910 [Clostridium beijerinckii]